MGKKFCCKLCDAPPPYIVGERPWYETNESYATLKTLGRRKPASQPEFYGAANQIVKRKADIDRETNRMVSNTFRVLANCIPDTRGKRFNRLDTLKKALQYIKELSESLRNTDDPVKPRDEPKQINSEIPTPALSGDIPAIQTFQNHLVTQNYPSTPVPIPIQPDYTRNTPINNRFYSSSPGSTYSSSSSDSSLSLSPEYKQYSPYTSNVLPFYYYRSEPPQYLHKSSYMNEKRFVAGQRPELIDLQRSNFYGRSNVTTGYPRTIPRI